MMATYLKDNMKETRDEIQQNRESEKKRERETKSINIKCTRNGQKLK